ncbi:hypothetical protein Bbelb_197940 [Branchiostoma belcheri]|nr:hypothetical protein Bbelb_197940 [Branchiostoma belcheri]
MGDLETQELDDNNNIHRTRLVKAESLRLSGRVVARSRLMSSPWHRLCPGRIWRGSAAPTSPLGYHSPSRPGVSLPNADVVPPEAKPMMTGDFCPDLCKPVDLKTQSEEFVQKPVMMAEFYPPHLLSFHIVRVGCPVWEKPVDLKMQKEKKTVGTVVNADPETGVQQEEEPDFCRQGCVKEDGEE